MNKFFHKPLQLTVEIIQPGCNREDVKKCPKTLATIEIMFYNYSCTRARGLKWMIG